MLACIAETCYDVMSILKLKSTRVSIIFLQDWFNRIMFCETIYRKDLFDHFKTFLDKIVFIHPFYNMVLSKRVR